MSHSPPIPSSSSQVGVDESVTLANAHNRGYELSGKIMLSAVVILFAVVIFMIFLHMYARWYLLRARRRQLQRRNRQRRQNLIFYADSVTTATVDAGSKGLDSDVMKSLPVFEFKEGLVLSECAVCLSEFEIGEKGRSLPKCSHSFHIECIDMWFASHATCPLCRAPVEEIQKSDEERIENDVVVVVDSATRSESEASYVPVTDSAALGFGSNTSSFGASMRNTQLETKRFSIEIPTRSETPTESPVGKLMSLRWILSRGLSISSPTTVEVSSPSACCDLETGVREETSRTQLSAS